MGHLDQAIRDHLSWFLTKLEGLKLKKMFMNIFFNKYIYFIFKLKKKKHKVQS